MDVNLFRAKINIIKQNYNKLYLIKIKILTYIKK